MSSGLSQAEIDALLSGNAIPPAEDNAQDSAGEPAEPPEVGEVPEEIQAESIEDSAPADIPEPDATFEMPEIEQPEPEPAVEPSSDDPVPEELLTTMEKDAVGEIGNISMGTAATTLFTLLNKRVDITTPRVSITNMKAIAKDYPLPFVAVQVAYTVGLVGNNILFMKEQDVKVITDLMMGGDGTNTSGELNELHLSAMSEVMNQMVGSSSTSLAKLIDTPIDIAPPYAYTVDLGAESSQPIFEAQEPVVKTSFTMDIEGLVHSEIMQIMPIDFAKNLVESMFNAQSPPAVPEAAPAPPPPASKPAPPKAAAPAASRAEPAPAPQFQDDDEVEEDYEPRPRRQKRQRRPEGNMVDVRPVHYDSFDEEDYFEEDLGDNMQLLMDVPLQVTVELGKSKKFIKEILDFNVGTIIVLDKMAGELVDVIVNGKLIAKGEVVVIDDNYGARITDIVSPSKRVNPLK